MDSWLSYGNQGATRNLPLSPDLARALSFLPSMGLGVEVFSGGQPSSGANRVGSTRHDEGNAADVFFTKDGRRLDWNNPADLPYFTEIVKRGKAAGLTGFGAGSGYMQPGSMHVGFGAPAVWGAGGKSANAPDWLVSAYGGAPTGPRSAGSASTSAMTNNGGPAMEPEQKQPGLMGLLRDPERRARLAMALTSMSMNPNQAILALGQERLAEAKGAREMNKTAQWLRGMGREDLATAVEAGQLGGGDAAKIALTPADRVKGVSVGDRLINPETGEVMYEPAALAAGRLTDDQLSNLNTLRDDLRTQTAMFDLVKSGYDNINSFYTNPGSVSDYALAVGFAKIVDPGSVAREGEVAAVANSGSLSEGMRQSLINAIQGGGTLPPQVRTEIARLAHDMYITRAKEADATVKRYQELAARSGLPADMLWMGSPIDVNPARPAAPVIAPPPAANPLPHPGQGGPVGVRPLSPRAQSYLP